MKITEQVRQFAEPVVLQYGCTLWDVEYVREGSDWFLRLYIDKDGGVNIADCEAISRAMDPILDEKDPIPDSYTFEVCSAGWSAPSSGRRTSSSFCITLSWSSSTGPGTVPRNSPAF